MENKSNKSEQTYKKLHSGNTCKSMAEKRKKETTLTRIDHMVGHKASLNKNKRFIIIQSTFSNHKTIQLETRKRNV